MDIFRKACLVWLAIGAILPSVLIHEALGADGPRTTIEVRIENRLVVAPKRPIRIVEKDAVDLRWVSDEAVKLHLHGYDKKLQLRPGVPAVMSLTAHATGRFPITVHGWGAQGHGHDALTYLEVHPR